MTSMEHADLGALTLALERLSSALAWLLRLPLPNFDEYSATTALTDGQYVSWDLLGAGFFWLVLLRGGICLGLGVFAYSRREIGR